MILSDLLDAPVTGPDGARLGFVVDVRLALELVDPPDEVPGGPPDREDTGHEDSEHERRDGADAPLSDRARRRSAVGGARVVGLLVSPRTAASFLGYERTDVRAPWPVPQLVRRRHRGTYLVRWEDVAAVDDDGVRLAAGYAEHDPALGEVPGRQA
ncbi:PRC-barrel domain containing protein [Cellulosimicrobium sp. NPDC057127]|uniref:PRC-barrel domain containing protein n=1 Tax=Cellulosimicrobium sp. NPDC057127 TaxID=3346026 RepID=UPI0036290E9D